MSTFPSLTLTGPPHERGLAHGERFADEISANVEIYLDRFAYRGADEAAVRAQADEYVTLIEDEHERYAAEMRGVAEGSGVPLEDVAVLNARYEVMYGAFARQAEALDHDEGATRSAGADGCTSFGVLPSATADGHTYIGENWDWIAAVAPNTFVMDVRREDGPDHVAVTEAGIVGGKMGVNEHGIGLVVNGLVSEGDGDQPYRTPFHVRCREVLDAERFDQAIGAVISTDRACSANFLLGHADGELIDLETAPAEANYLYPDEGVLTHANHFEGGGVDSEFEKLVPHSLFRSPRLRRLLARERGQLDEAVLREALTDHFNRPASICRHVDESLPPQEQVQSNVSVVVDLTERRVAATNRPPCETDYDSFVVSGG